MSIPNRTDIFEQLHIDVARNATDDFNLFHDQKKWQLINQNPFNGTIALGFQLESLIEHKVRLYRQELNEDLLIRNHKLRFSNYQFSFVNAVKPGQQISVDIKKSQSKKDVNTVLSNRVAMRADGQLVLMGYKKESQTALYLPNHDFSSLENVRNYPDRSYLPDSLFFIKRKFMNTSNAKNFLCGSLVDQAIFFDELEDKADFPEIFPCSLISCALLEKATIEGHDFKRNPMIYTSHKISIDRSVLAELKSNDALQILVKETESGSNIYECFGLVNDNAILYSAFISLASLDSIFNSLKKG